MIPSVVLLGNLLVDDVVFPDGTTRMGQAGGALLYSALGAALWGKCPGLVSVVGDDYPADVLEQLQGRGVDLGGVRRLGGPGVRTWLLYEGQIRRLIHRLGCPSHEEVSPNPGLIPPGWAAAPAFHLAPMPIDMQYALIRSLRCNADAFISVDPHVPVTEATLPRWRELLADADAFFPAEDELLLDGVHTDPRAALPRLATGRLRFVVFKRGARGGILYDAHHDRYYEWDPRTAGVVDQTGAGDAFAAGFLIAHLEGLGIEPCLQRAIVTASFAIAAWGPDALLATVAGAADARWSNWFGVISA